MILEEQKKYKIKQEQNASEANDPALMISNFQTLQVGDGTAVHYGATCSYTFLTKDPVLIEVYNAFMKAKFNIERTRGVEITPVKPSMFYTLGYSSKAGQDIRKEILNKVETMLPDKPMCDLIMKNFLSISSGMWPFLDISYITSDFRNITDITPDNRYKFRLDDDSSCIIFCIFLVVLRLGYVTLPFFYGEGSKILSNPQYSIYKPLMDNNVKLSPEIVQVAEMMFSSVSNNQADSASFQFLLCLIIYRIGFSGDHYRMSNSYNSRMLLARIIQTAIIMGYHRDPDIIMPNAPAEIKNMRRIYWTFLIFMDSQQSFLYGKPLIVNKRMTDTKKPVMYPEYQQSQSKAKWIEYYQLLHEMTPCFQDGTELILGLKNRLHNSDLENLSDRILKLINSQLTPAAEIVNRLTNGDYSLKSSDIRQLLCRTVLTSQYHACYYIMYMNCSEDERELQHHYLKRGLCAAVVNLRLSAIILQTCQQTYSYAMLPYLCSILLLNMNRALLFIISIFIRSQKEEYRFSIHPMKPLYQPIDIVDLGLDTEVEPYEKSLLYYPKLLYELLHTFYGKNTITFAYSTVIWVLIGVAERGIHQKDLEWELGPLINGLMNQSLGDEKREINKQYPEVIETQRHSYTNPTINTNNNFIKTENNNNNNYKEFTYASNNPYTHAPIVDSLPTDSQYWEGLYYDDEYVDMIDYNSTRPLVSDLFAQPDVLGSFLYQGDDGPPQHL